MNVLTDNGAKTFFPREECIMNNCSLNPLLVLQKPTALLTELFLQILQGKKTLIIATSTVGIGICKKTSPQIVTGLG